jgi:hydrogenase/urease accessory protein HupE
MRNPTRSALAAALAALATPLALAAHEGHAGDHGWLAGAAEPLLSWDHFLAGAFAALVVAVGVAAVGRLTRGTASQRTTADV